MDRYAIILSANKKAKRLADKHLAMYAEGFFFIFSGAIFEIRWFESFCRLNGSISKKTFFRVSWVRVLAEKGWICFGRDYL